MRTVLPAVMVYKMGWYKGASENDVVGRMDAAGGDDTVRGRVAGLALDAGAIARLIGLDPGGYFCCSMAISDPSG